MNASRLRHRSRPRLRQTHTPTPRRANVRLSGERRRGIFFVDANVSAVVAQLSPRTRWGSDGASLGSVSAFSHDPLRADMNLYRYVGNNPVINTDPSGLIWALYDIPASCWKCNLVAFVLSGYASGWDTLLFNYWNSGNGGPSSGTPWELKPSQFGVFDTDGSQRASAWKFVEGSAKGLAANLKCGESKSGTFSQGKTSASSGTRMISGYQFWFDATYKVTKNCDADGNCTSIDVSATCNFHASDTVDFWNTPPKKNGQWDESGMFGALGIRITDRLVRACYPNGRGFNLTANLSDTKSWSIPCGKPCDKPPISSTNNPGLPHYGEPKW